MQKTPRTLNRNVHRASERERKKAIQKKKSCHVVVSVQKMFGIGYIEFSMVKIFRKISSVYFRVDVFFTGMYFVKLLIRFLWRFFFLFLLLVRSVVLLHVFRSKSRKLPVVVVRFHLLLFFSRSKL